MSETSTARIVFEGRNVEGTPKVAKAFQKTAEECG